MKKILIIVLLFYTVLSWGLLNLGTWLDVTKAPMKSDLVVCLGGGTVDRVKKSIALIEEGYTDKFLLLGESWYNQPYIQKNYPNLAVEIDESPKNTKEEVLFIKQYMIEHSYKSVLIVTDLPHSRRVKLLTSILRVKGDENLTFNIVGGDVKWWDDEHYWKNKRACTAVWHESVKVVYTVLVDCL